MNEKELLAEILEELREMKKELQISNEYLKPVQLKLSKYLPREVNLHRSESQ